MSVYVKMPNWISELPKSCSQCQYCDNYYSDDFSTQVCNCSIISDNIYYGFKDYEKRRLEQCPLIVIDDTIKCGVWSV